jgi:hypothetical protein
MVAFFVRSLELLMNVLIVLGVATVFVAAGAAGFGGISIENGQTWGGPIPFLVVLLGGLIYLTLFGGFVYLGLGIYKNTKRSAEALERLTAVPVLSEAVALPSKAELAPRP